MTSPAREPGFNARERLARLESEVERIRDQLDRLREGLAALLRIVERLGIRPSRDGAMVERLPLATAARRLGVGSSTLRRWIAEGHVEGLAITGPGGRKLWSVDLAAVEALERGAAGASERTPERGQPRAATSAPCSRDTDATDSDGPPAVPRSKVTRASTHRRVQPRRSR